VNSFGNTGPPLDPNNNERTANCSNNTSTNEIDYITQIPIVFSKAVIKLVARYITSMNDQCNLEQLFGNPSTTNIISPTLPASLTYLTNFLMPLLIWSASDTKDSPKLNSSDISFIVTIILNALKPPSKLAASLLLQAPKQHHLSAFDALNNPSNSTGFHKSAKQIKDLISQATFLALKLITFEFSKQIELARIAVAIRQICTKVKSVYLWRFLEFITKNKSPLFLILKPFIENFIAVSNCDSDAEAKLRKSIESILKCKKHTNSRCNDLILNELVQELNSIKSELQCKYKLIIHQLKMNFYFILFIFSFLLR
jgi:hypothetical protein